MGLFSKKPKLNPKIVVEEIVIEFHLEHGWWEFTYRGTEFTSCGHSLSLPTKAELDTILDTLESLKPEMKLRLKKGLSEWPGSKADDGETYFVEVGYFLVNATFTVSWAGGASWGDLGVEFIIKDHTIIDEDWCD